MTRKILTAIIALLGFSAAAYAQSAAPQAAGVAWRGDELRACRQTALRLRADGWREVVQHPDLIWHLLTKNENYLWARPALHARKLRDLELKADYKPARGRKGAAHAYNLKSHRDQERRWVEQAETAGDPNGSDRASSLLSVR